MKIQIGKCIIQILREISFENQLSELSSDILRKITPLGDKCLELVATNLCSILCWLLSCLTYPLQGCKHVLTSCDKLSTVLHKRAVVFSHCLHNALELWMLYFELKAREFVLIHIRRAQTKQTQLSYGSLEFSFIFHHE